MSKWKLESALLRPRMWVRYVDDTFVLWPQDDEQELNAFLQHLNSQQPAIQFTMEKEKDERIAFLDVLVERREGSISTGVYRKDTHTHIQIDISTIPRTTTHIPRLESSPV